MIVSKHNILGLFHRFNEKYFDGALPIPNVKTIPSYNKLGRFEYNLDSFGNVSNETLMVSNYYDFTENEITDIIVHEMIHYLLVLNGKDLKCKHGKEFKKISDDLNIRYGLNIVDYVDVTRYKLKNGKSRLIQILSSFF